MWKSLSMMDARRAVGVVNWTGTVLAAWASLMANARTWPSLRQVPGLAVEDQTVKILRMSDHGVARSTPTGSQARGI